MSVKECFVVSPIGEAGSEIRRRADQVLKHVVIPSVVECGFDVEDVVRADTISNPGAITHQIITSIINSDLVIADLTGNNANVYYELAIRHVLRKPYVQICDVNTALPFDVKNQRTIMFDYKDLDSVADAKRLLVEYAKSALAQPDSLMTPIHEGLIIDGLLTSEKPSEQILGKLMENVADLTNEVRRISGNYSSKERKIRNSIDNFDEIDDEIFEYKKLKSEKIGLSQLRKLEPIEQGMEVSHGKWGIGEVIKVKGELLETEVTISFPPPVGYKRLLAAFAPLEKVE
ncbi:hypothetical protein [Paenibacillus sp. FSL H3-0310]|uniref:hypothetical protein n=1 Tax=Paenibacillus sp. FSL H3-0310 TaxID=2921429 RepID=UPI004040778F